MSGFRIQGDSSNNVAEVNSDKELNVSLSKDHTKAGFSALTSAVDEGSVTGYEFRIDPEASTDYKLRIGLDTFVFNDFFPGTVLNTNIWTNPATTMTTTLLKGFANLNAAASVASAAVAILQSIRTFQIYGAVKTYFESSIQFTSLPVTGNVCEWGLLLAATTAAPTDGCFFRINQFGEFRAVLNCNGVERQSDVISFSELASNNKTNNFIICIGTNTVQFWINDILVANFEQSIDGPNSISSCSLPALFRNYNSAAVSTAQIMKVCNVNITYGDNNYSKPYQHQLAGSGYHCSLTQSGSAKHGQTTVWANSANPTAATPTNTTAALGSGLGGIFIANINGLAAGTDFIISSYQVPVATAVIPGKTLYLTGVRVSAVNTGAANGLGATTYALALAYGHTSVSLATAEAATTKAPRRIPIGVQSLDAAAIIGAVAKNDITYDFNTPIVVQQSEFVQVIMRLVANNSAASQALNFYISFNGYFE